MSRASGKHNAPRGPAAPSPEPVRALIEPGDTPVDAAVRAVPDSPQARDIGASERTQAGWFGSPIPGGRPHLGNAPTVRNRVVSPEPGPEYSGMMAHGVPPGEATTGDRAAAMRGPNHPGRDKLAPAAERPERFPPVGVYITSGPEQGSTRRLASPRRVFCRIVGEEPTKLCGVDHRRYRIGLLNEDTVINARFADSPGALAAAGTGATMAAVLPAVTNSYLWIHTQGELWANADGTAGVYVSMIQEFDQP